MAAITCRCIVIATLLVLQAGVPGSGGPAVIRGAQPEAPGQNVTLAFGGDVLLGEDVNTYVARHGPAAPLADVPELGAADLAVVNLETVVAPGADALDTGDVGDHFFLGRPETLGLLEAAGIDVVSTANNHARDFGVAALLAEDRLLTEMGMAHPGIGRTSAEACAPVYLTARDLRIALFSVDATQPAAATGDGEFGTCHLASDDRAGWERVFGPGIAEARRRADVVVVMPHFRASFRVEPDPADREVAWQLIDLGADAVLGAGAHALQGMEVRNGRPIVHGAGSLLFNFEAPDEAALFVLSLSTAGVETIQTVPLITERSWTRQARPAEAAAILAAIDARSRALGTAVSRGGIQLAPEARERPLLQPDDLWALDPGPAPGAVTEPPPACTAAAVPEGAAVAPSTMGPLSLIGIRTEGARLQGPELMWLETFWRIDARTASDLTIALRAAPAQGTPWEGVHEPCDWAWPTSRWEPGVIYRDRYPLRPPPEVQRMGGLPAIVSGTGYGPLAISVGVRDQDRSVGASGALRTVVLDPSAAAWRLGIISVGAAVVVLLIAVGARSRRRRRARSA